MKRTPIRRKSLKTKRAKSKKPRKALKKVNVARQARRRAAYRKYLHSPEWKLYRTLVLTRDGNRCTASLPDGSRCPETERLEVHHENYNRFRKELLEDCATLCRGHHREEEYRKRGYKRCR